MILIGAAWMSASVAHGPSRQKVDLSVQIAAPAAKVWALIGDFCAIAKWHPAVAQCAGEGGNEIGATRVLTLHGGARISEELQQYDAAQMSYKYKITQTDMSALPVTTYAAFLSVSDRGDGTSNVNWRGGFYRGFPNANPPPEQNDEAAVKAVTSVYESGLARIKELVEQ
jgi:hypothetical protein